MTNRKTTAAERWRAVPAKDRREVEHFFRDEARQSDDWAEDAINRADGVEFERHKNDAKAMRAALAVLREAAKGGGR
jgi:hypothetical protein